MLDRNGSAGDVELSIPNGTTLPGGATWPDTSTLALKLDPESDPNWKPGTPWSVASALSAASGAAPFVSRLTPRLQKSFGRGIGLDYNAAYGLWTRDGYVMPAGAASGVQLIGTGLTHSTSSPLVAFAEYGGDLYIGQQGLGSGNGGRVLKITGGDGTASESMFLSAGDLLRDLIVADDGSGTTVLFATSESSTHTNARLHKYDGASWTHTIAGTEFSSARGLGRMAYEFMNPEGGANGDWRIVFITGLKTFAYTNPGANPMLGTASLSADIKIGTQGSLLEIAAARRHFWFGATDNLYDVDELANSSGLTSFTRAMQQTGNGLAVLYMDGYVYMSLGRGLVRVRVDQGAVLNERPAQCAPGWGTPAENDVRGYVTAMCPDQGGFFTATYNPSVLKSYICWNVARGDGDTSGDSRNPLYAYGPEVVFDVDYKVTRMLTSGLAGDLRLWIASQSAGGTARLDWVSLPIAGSPLQDLISGGGMKFNTGAAGNVVQPNARLELLKDGWDDGGASNHILYQDTFVTRGLSKVVQQDGTIVDDGFGTKLTSSSRADPPPGSTTWTSSDDVTVSPNQDVTGSGTVQGHQTQLRVDFVCPQGGASTPKVGVLDAVRRLGWVESPAVRVVSLPVVYGDGADTNLLYDPDDITATLMTLTSSTKITLRDAWNKRWTFKLDQVLGITEVGNTGGRWGKTVHARLQGAYVAGPL